VAASRSKRGKGGGTRRLGTVLGGLFLLLLLVSLALRYGPDLGERWASRGERGGGDAAVERAAGQAPPSDAPAAQSAPAPRQEAGPRPLRLQILNATSQNRLALETGEKLRRWDVDTLDRANAPPWPFPETLLIVRSRRGEAVRRLARRLGGIPVIVQRREDLMLDATLLLGHDWERYRWPE
jgi:hypothetical protein